VRAVVANNFLVVFKKLLVGFKTVIETHLGILSGPILVICNKAQAEYLDYQIWML